MKKIFYIPGFENKAKVEKRVRELNKINGSLNIFYTSYIKTIGFALVVPEEDMVLLSNEEKKRAQLLTTHCNPISYIPQVFRYIPEEYVDEFFMTGAIRLTTFEACGDLQDDLRKDDSEGLVEAKGYGASRSINISMEKGYTAYIFCTSLSNKSTDPMGNYYKYAIEILEPSLFIDAACAALLKEGILLKRVLAGPCLYSEKVVERTIDDKVIGNIKSLEDIFTVADSASGSDIYFRKENSKKEEHEFRFVFDTTKTVKEPIRIYIPEMIPFCRKKVFDWR